MKKVREISNDEKKYIIIKGCRQHNLKNIDIAIPKDQLVVITGPSGSGKSSLALDTIYAEGQRKYVESLSSYARQFIGRMNKPDMDSIRGLVPSIAIEQKVLSANPRSTVGTSTDIYDYLKLLFARIGITYSPKTGKPIQKQTISDVIDFIKSCENEAKGLVLTELKDARKSDEYLKYFNQNGYLRVLCGNLVVKIEEFLKQPDYTKKLFLVIERFVVSDDEDLINNLSDSISTAFEQGSGYCTIMINDKLYYYSNLFEEDGISYEEATPDLFSFNNSYGACKTCEGFGTIIGVSEDLIIPDKSKSLYEGAVLPWRGEKMSKFRIDFIENSKEYNFPIHYPYFKLSQEQKKILWKGVKGVVGLNDFFEYIESKSHKIHYRVFLSRFRGKTNCPNCLGTRLREDAGYVSVHSYSIIDMVLMPISKLLTTLDKMAYTDYEKNVAKYILPEITTRLQALNDLGLGYLTLNRASKTLSGGESQRIKLAGLIGASIVGASYILDEPSIGLHSIDTLNLIKVLQQLRDKGNSVYVVEHDEDIIKSADYLIDIGPEAGYKGGEVMYQGPVKGIEKIKNSLTAQYLKKELKISISNQRPKAKTFIRLNNVHKHNLKNVNISIPLNRLVVVCGVSGSGKTTLIKEHLYSKLNYSFKNNLGKIPDIEIDENINHIEFIDQQPIGTSTRSNTATYTKLWDHIREFYCSTPMAKSLQLKPSNFSFNVEGGRCETCKGDGRIEIEMQFLSNIFLTCEACQGKRFKDHILEVEYKGKNISDILNKTVDELLEFFEPENKKHLKLREKLIVLQQVGLGYIKIGQSSDTFSGGEAQRLKLSTFLMKGVGTAKTIFIFDEPTTGLHYHDVNKLLQSLNALVQAGHSVIVIEHHLDVIQCADHIIEIGPKGGGEGGKIIFEGTPKELLKRKDTPTSSVLNKR